MSSILRHRGGRRRGNTAYGRALSIEYGRVAGEGCCRKVPERCSSEVRSGPVDEVVSRSTGLVLMSERLDVWGIEM